MTTTSTDLIITLPNVRAGNSYFVAVTGATTAVALEFQHEEGGAWFPQPGFNATPSGGVIFSNIACISPLMRVRAAAGQVTPWTATCVKQVMDKF